MTGVERRALRELLDVATRRRVCMVIGAAGWGKSTAVGSWARERPAAWMQHDNHQAGPDRFARRLREALQPYAPAAPMDFPEPQSAGEEGYRSYAAAVCAWLRDALHEDVVLVVDDLEELAPGSGAADLLEGLCQLAPDRLHLVLISRRELPFSLARLRGQGMVAEIHAPELALDVAEVAALLRSTIGDEQPDLPAQLRERTGGWPALTCRAVETLQSVEPDHRADALERLTRPGERLHAYLGEEVLGSEDERVRQLLRRLAVFGKVGVTSVTASGTDNGTGVLAELERRGLVRRIPGHLDRWALVRPLRDYFDHEPALTATERARLHRIAAVECTGRGAHADALRHFVAAGDHAACWALLVDHGATLVNRGQVGAVLMAAELPPEYLADARIQGVLGQALQVRGQWAGALEYFQRAGDDQDELDPALAWRIGLIAYTKGEFGEVLALSGRTRLAREDTADEARLLALVAGAYRMVGDYPGCRKATERALDAARRSADPCAHAAGYGVLATLAAAEGDRRQADAHFASALETAEAGDDLLQVLRTRVCRASHLLEMGLPHDALGEAQTALRLGESCGDPFLTASALTTRARANARMGVLEPALGDLATARDLLQRIGSRLLARPLCGLGDIYRMRCQRARAQAAYEEALALAEPCHDVLGLSGALIGLARVRAADDIAAAHKLAEQAVALGEGLCHVQALLTRGWVSLMAGDDETAAADAAQAAAAARLRRDDPGLAEALTLGVLSSADPAQHSATLAEAIQIWAETGYRVEEATGRVVAERIRATIPDVGAHLAKQTLRDCRVDLESRSVAGPLAAADRSVPALSIRSLGVFAVLRDGVPIPTNAWQSRKARDVLKILVARRRPVTRDQLMELLWPDGDPTRSGNRLSVLLSTVRDVLAPPARDADSGLLATDGNVVWLDRTRVTVDVEEFLARAGAALEAHRRGQGDATGRLVAAEAEHTGDFLEDDPYQEWVAPLADEVRASYVAVLRALVSRLRGSGDVDGVVRYALRLLEQDSYDEQAHLDLLHTHLEAGHHGEARRRYQVYVRQMTELGVEPRPFPVPRRSRGG